MHAVAAEASASHCRNCGVAFSDPTPAYCPSCGQETAPHPPTVWEFGHEFITHYVALEGKLWNTLGLLFFKPGELTRRYLIGQKRRHVNPLRLYLTASILFFIVVKLFGAGSLVRTDFKSEEERLLAANEVVTAVKEEAKTATTARAPQSVTSKALPNLTIKLPTSDKESAKHATPTDRKRITLNSPAMDAIQCEDSNACQKIRAHFEARYKDKTLREFGGIARDRALSLAPYAMFLFLPVFAALTYLLYRKRGMYYGEHVVYALHVHAFAYFYLMAFAFAADWLGNLLALWGMIYFWLAMRRVFAGRWWATSLRYMVIGTLYPLMLLVFVSVTMLVAIFI
jgi:Protein of unknown function (DUF3667)